MSKDVVVILTALNLEYEAVRRKLAGLQVRRHERGTRFEVGTVQGTSRCVALGLTNKGNNSAAVIAERAIQEFSPVAVLFVGVAGALWDTARLGDVVMATHVYAYHGGTSEDDGLKGRPRVWETAHGISQLGSHLARVNDWAEDMAGHGRVPQVRFGPIAAGEVVQNSTISAEARWIRQHYNDALAIEMEAAGVAQAGHLNGAPVAIIRGISDRADGTKSSAKDRNWQPRAAANAAAFATRLAVELVGEQEQIAMSQADGAHTTDRVEKHVSNTSHNSTVGIMASSVRESSVYVNADPKVTSPADLVAELDAFREHLKRHHAEGALDNDTYQEGLAELGFARRAARENTAEPSKRATMALKRLRGLIAECPELVARLAPLVVAAGELS
ncbi:MULTISPECIES: 5'-methylthioadenosine/S-adenosylhomocysteine nucleosidase [unclassified Streptomyces]|uniref:5'-methylthioadenosine/S-adenosylhomocysteine nucleosidase family protein n=1 Tax=unclassified Streptomyces TaxID=2593676 RepID=UPI001BB0C1E6|nr:MULTISPECIES: 5'-methylthioadenosine/S-adenosylhomocysteine nucleosidase [unclassified Streptomyces]QUW92925.1 5'-methylthioadenosine/S-adenosylhomocysteine nucleosidase [Streptomyces sp. V17-9]WKX19484.1 5'-methylthioadenosine/S-adenosylhomocysteine nucleosidase [Streptomyces sp. HUAS CX7]